MTAPDFQKNNRLLVVDDNQAIHADFRKILRPPDALAIGLDAAGAAVFGEAPQTPRSAGFEIDSAFSGEDGLTKVREALAQGRPYALAFVDVRMAPGWNGIETTAHIFKHDPDIQIVICTAYSDYSWDEMIAKLGQTDRLVILKKPFDTVEVLQLAHALTEKWELGQQAHAKTAQLEKMVAVRTHELQAANEKLKIEMAERAQAEEALRQAQKMEAVGQLAGGIAHDFNNLLTVIRGYVEFLTLEMRAGPVVSEALREIETAAERATKLTSQLLMFSRKKAMQRKIFDLNEVISALDTMLRRALGENIDLDIQIGAKPLTLHADPVMIEMVILNLAMNARDAMPQGGQLLIQADEIEIKTEDCQRHASAVPGRFACILVRDNGCGIAPEVLSHLFEPFFTTKEVGKGTGLGLASVYGIVTQHAGWIEVESAPGRGATFKVFLPVTAIQAGPAIPKATKSQIPGGKETILLVEDEPALRRLARTVIQRQGYRVYEAASGTEALAVWKEHGPEINLLLTDMVMPGGMTGWELAEQLRTEKNDLKVIYSSGYNPEAVSQNLPLKEGANFLAKPYHPDKLLRIIRQCLDGGVQA
jgi:signal transduction histidine kinase